MANDPHTVLLTALIDLQGKLNGATVKPITVSLANEAFTLSIRIGPPHGGDEVKSVGERPSGDIVGNILEALDVDTMMAPGLAERAGYKLNSHFRTVLAKMAKAGQLCRTVDGYQLPVTGVSTNGHHNGNGHANGRADGKA